MADLARTGARGTSATRLGGAAALPILMYHALPSGAEGCRTPIDIPLPEFDGHLRALTQGGWRVLGLTAALAARAADPGARIVALTVDDGFADVTRASDVVRAAGGSWTVYLPTAFIDGRRDTASTFSHPLLTWDRVKDLVAAGVEIGSHAVSHRPLDVMPTQDVRRELAASRARLSEVTQTSVVSLCYPYGYTSRRTCRIVADAGYENACIVGRRIARGNDPVLALPRLQPMPGMAPEQIISLVRRGEAGVLPPLKRLAQPAWRGVRHVAGRFGVEWT